MRQCSDRIDNDGDGFVDCRDQDCGIFASCVDAGADSDSDVDGDTDIDTDSDSDTDSDTGTDSDSESDSGSDSSSESDTRPDDPCSLVSAGGIDVPEWTIAEASSFYEPFTPDQAIDRDEGTYWNATDTVDWIKLTLPGPRTIDGVYITAITSPSSRETFEIYGFDGPDESFIGSDTQDVAEGGPRALDLIPVDAGTYDAIRIDITSVSSWVAVNEISLATEACP